MHKSKQSERIVEKNSGAWFGREVNEEMGEKEIWKGS